MLGLGLLRRLLVGGSGEDAEPVEGEPGEPEAAARIDAARRRLKDTIPPPEDNEPAP